MGTRTKAWREVKTYTTGEVLECNGDAHVLRGKPTVGGWTCAGPCICEPPAVLDTGWLVVTWGDGSNCFFAPNMVQAQQYADSHDIEGDLRQATVAEWDAIRGSSPRAGKGRAS